MSKRRGHRHGFGGSMGSSSYGANSENDQDQRNLGPGHDWRPRLETRSSWPWEGHTRNSSVICRSPPLHPNRRYVDMMQQHSSRKKTCSLRNRASLRGKEAVWEVTGELNLQRYLRAITSTVPVTWQIDLVCHHDSRSPRQIIVVAP